MVQVVRYIVNIAAAATCLFKLGGNFCVIEKIQRDKYLAGLLESLSLLAIFYNYCKIIVKQFSFIRACESLYIGPSLLNINYRPRFIHTICENKKKSGIGVEHEF